MYSQQTHVFSKTHVFSVNTYILRKHMYSQQTHIFSVNTCIFNKHMYIVENE